MACVAEQGRRNGRLPATLDSIHSAQYHGLGRHRAIFSPARCLFLPPPPLMMLARPRRIRPRMSETPVLMKRAKATLPFCRISKGSIDVSGLASMVSAVENCAVCTFVGQVRNLSRGKKVAYLEYDAYVPMAEKMLAKIAAEAADKWKAQIAIEHRIGRIELGEPSVAVCVGSPHRDAAFEACRYCIDTLKETV